VSEWRTEKRPGRWGRPTSVTGQAAQLDDKLNNGRPVGGRRRRALMNTLNSFWRDVEHGLSRRWQALVKVFGCGGRVKRRRRRR
jgi:hypothetical protein